MSIYIDEDICNGCGKAEEAMCVMVCPGDLLFMKPERKAAILERLPDCWDCAACVKHCPVGAIDLRLPLEISDENMSLRAKVLQTRTRWTLEFADGRQEILDIPIADTRDADLRVQEAPDSTPDSGK